MKRREPDVRELASEHVLQVHPAGPFLPPAGLLLQMLDALQKPHTQYNCHSCFLLLLSGKVGRAPAAINYAADTGWDTDQLWAQKWRRIVYVGCKKKVFFRNRF